DRPADRAPGRGRAGECPSSRLGLLGRFVNSQSFSAQDKDLGAASSPARTILSVLGGLCACASKVTFPSSPIAAQLRRDSGGIGPHWPCFLPASLRFSPSSRQLGHTIF